MTFDDAIEQALKSDEKNIITTYESMLDYGDLELLVRKAKMANITLIITPSVSNTVV